ncbi:uncharacterized protein LOC144436441 [Glandiceps talaboti]
MASILNPKSKSYKKFDDEKEPEGKDNTGLEYIGDDTSIEYTVEYKKLQEEGVIDNTSTAANQSEFPVLVIPQDTTLPTGQPSETVNVYLGKGGQLSAPSGDATQQIGQQNGAVESINPRAIAVLTKLKTGKLPPVEPPPKDYLYCSIFVTIFCCPVLGLLAVHQALQSRRAAAKGYKTRVRESSRMSWKFAKIGFLIGLLLQIILIFALFEALA